jgi:hypothetical protein
MAARAVRQSVERELTTWVEGLPQQFVACRDMGHAWRPFTAAWDGAARVFRRELRCTRCKTSRVQTLNARGHIESSWYEYPDDYLRPPGSGAYDQSARDLMHLVSVQHLVDQAQRGAA